MANKNEIVKLTDGVYQIKYYWLGIANVYAYLIVGSERALLIDTCYSITGIKKYVEQITTLPVDVVNTHGHFDHIGGNAEFETIYLSKADREVAGEHSDYNALRKMIDNYEEKNVLVRYLFKLKKYKKQVEDSLHIKSVEYKDLPLCGFFNLGERKVSFIETPGHTPGSICLFDEKSKYQMPAKSDIFERYISLCNDILSGKLTGKYEDQGLCDGKVVKGYKLQMVYRKIK